MKILIGGASGLIGRALIDHLTNLGFKVIALSRSPEQHDNSYPAIKWKKWRDNDASDWQQDLENCDVIVNLIGESLAGMRWTKERRRLLLSSRVDACNLFVKAISAANNKPKTFVQASAIGIYSTGQDLITEDDGEKGGNFLADLTEDWERASEKIGSYAVKRILLRTGLVLASNSLIISKFKLPFNLFAGGHLGNGRQIMSWIHIQDLVQAVSFIIANNRESHIYNLSSPNPVSMKEFCKALGKAMNRPSWLHVPAFVLELLFGKEMARQTMLSGEAVLPINLKKLEFTFQYPEIGPALKSLF